MGPGRRQLGWRRLLARASAVTLAAAPLPILPGHGHDAGVHVFTTGNHSELVRALPIARHPRKRSLVVMSLTPRDLPAIRAGDRLKVSAEVQFSTTCSDPSPHCVGRHYDFDPRVGARLELADGGHVTGGRGAQWLTDRSTVRCRQRRPNRNHHCVIVFTWSRTRFTNDQPLPCDPRQCFINLVMDAANRKARPHQVVVLGGDRPDGSVEQDKGRLNAVLVHRHASANVMRSRTDNRRTGILPLDAGSPGREVVYSAELDGLRKGDKLVVGASQVADIGALTYPAFLSSNLVLAESPSATEPGSLARSVASLHGLLDEANGFNCTQGISAYTTPCQTVKVGVARIRQNPRAPLYVSLVSRAKALLTAPSPGDVAGIIPGGHLTVVRYRP
jgi:hypothetical protein